MLSDPCLVEIAQFLYFSDVWRMMKACDRTDATIPEVYRSLGEMAEDIRDVRLVYHPRSILEGVRRTDHEEMVELLLRSDNRIPGEDWNTLYTMDVWRYGRLDHHRVMKRHLEEEWMMLMDRINEPKLYRKCFLMKHWPLEEAVIFFTPTEINEILEALEPMCGLPAWYKLYQQFISYSWMSRM